MISKDIEIAPSGMALSRNAPCAQPAISLLVSYEYVATVSTITNLLQDHFSGTQ